MTLLLVQAVTMVSLLAVLLLAGLLMIYQLLKTRMAAIEERLDQLAGAVRDSARAEPPPPPSAEVAPVAPVAQQVDLTPLEQRLLELDDLVRGTNRRLEDLLAEFHRERGSRLRETIERLFQGRGFQSIRILTDLSEYSDETVRVSLEGVKGGITYKGFVQIENGAVVNENMTSSHEVFP